MSADAAPKAYSVGDVVMPKQWAAKEVEHYSLAGELRGIRIVQTDDRHVYRAFYTGCCIDAARRVCRSHRMVKTKVSFLKHQKMLSEVMKWRCWSLKFE
jgi:hypothetical protein